MQIRLDFLRERLDQIAFIEIKKTLEIRDRLKVDRNLPLPVNAKVVKEKIHDTDPSFLQSELVEGILLLMGLDPSFKYADSYKKLLLAIDEKILEITANHLLQNINEENQSDTLIQLVGLVHLGFESDAMLVQIGRLSQELYIITEDQEYDSLSYRIFVYLKKQETQEALPYYYLGYHEYNKGRYSEAEKHWEKSMQCGLGESEQLALVEIQPQLKLRLVYEEGVDLIFKGRYTEGVEKLLSIRDEFSEWWNLMFFIGLGYRYQEEYQKAIYYFNRANEINPEQEDVLNELGISYTMMRENDHAILVFSRALTMNPDNHEILCNLGITYYNMGNMEQAKKVIKRAHKLSPEDEVTNQWVNHLKISNDE
jgi:tetratricopeptide (TPR) repeat protein